MPRDYCKQKERGVKSGRPDDLRTGQRDVRRTDPGIPPPTVPERTRGEIESNGGVAHRRVVYQTNSSPTLAP